MMGDGNVRTIYKMDLDDWLGSGFIGLLLALATGALIYAVIAVTCSARSSGSPDYCVVAVEKATGGVIPSYRLWAHRPWSADIMVGTFHTFEEAASASERLACPFRAP